MHLKNKFTGLFFFTALVAARLPAQPVPVQLQPGDAVVITTADGELRVTPEGNQKVTITNVPPTPPPTPPPITPPTTPPPPKPVPLGIWPSSRPLSASPSEVPAWEFPVASGPSTYKEALNGWVDEFQHGLSFASMSEGYRVFDQPHGQGSLFRTQHFRDKNRWFVDVAGHGPNGSSPPFNHGSTMMKIDRTFRFENGRLVIEADVAAGIAAYDINAWTELIVSNAPAPTGKVADILYGYGTFGGQWALGIRLQPSRVPIAAMYQPDGQRVFELSFFQNGGAQVFGGGPFNPALNAAWRVGTGETPAAQCTDRFRWELTRDTLTLYVNGVKYMEHSQLPAGKQLPAALLNGDVHVYFASVVYQPVADTVRFSWGRVAVNPTTPPSPSASFGK